MRTARTFGPLSDKMLTDKQNNLLQAVALDTDVWRRVANNVRERHGHELMCAQLAQVGQTWFEVTIEGTYSGSSLSSDEDY